MLQLLIMAVLLVLGTALTDAGHRSSTPILKMKPHLLGILRCTLVAAALGIGAVVLFDYGFTGAPAAVSRRFIEHGFWALLHIVRAFYYPLAWDETFCSQSPWTAAIVAAVIWGVIFHVVLRLGQAAKQRLFKDNSSPTAD